MNVMRKYNIAAFTGEKDDPSSRYRIRQYVALLHNKGVSVDDYYSKVGKYPPVKKSKRLLWGTRIITERFKQITSYRKRSYDVTILQREMISTLITFESLVHKPFIFDVDDAIHLRKSGRKIIKIAKKADAIVCGNQYLTDFYANYSNNIYILPTPVDTDRYIPITPENRNSNEVIIGWIGTSGNFKFLYKIQKALKYILESHMNSRLLIVSNDKPEFKEPINYDFIKWSEETEISNIQSIDIGLMPLDYSEWAKGKCSFKMLQYMSCGIPVIVTPIGMNVEVSQKGRIGFTPTDFNSGWIDALEKLINNEVLRLEMGTEGRKVVEAHYSLKICTDKLYEIIKEVSK